MRAGVLRSIVSLPKSAAPRFEAAFQPYRVAFVRHASTVSIFCQGRANDVFTSTRANCLRQAIRRQLSFKTTEDATIYALSTAPGTAAIAIIRISGTACIDVQY